VLDPSALGLDAGQVPGDHSRQALADDYIPRLAPSAGRVLDLGCGTGESVDAFRAAAPGAAWVGVDIADSPEVRARTRADAEFHSFDGTHLPFEDASFDLVYTKQVLEHVRHPEPLLADVARVVCPGGVLVGSTSQLEPFHSRSLWNYTPYGLGRLLESAGLELEEVRPGIDAPTLIARRALRGPRLFDRWWARESPLNAVISAMGAVTRRTPRQVNVAKLTYCGQFCFVARRPDGARAPSAA
jgi:SAM-dependent methyltransferase